MQVKFKVDCELAAKEHFLKTVTMDNDGSYQITLSWVDGRQKIPSIKEVAAKMQPKG